MPLRVATGVEGYQVGRADTPCGEHRQHRYRCMNPLAVHEIPALTLPDHGGDPRREVVVPAGRPGWNAQHPDAIENFIAGTPAAPVSREHGDVEAFERRQPPRDLVDVRLDPTQVRQVTRTP